MLDITIWIFGWPLRCIVHAIVGILYPPTSPAVRRWQFVTLALLLMGIAGTVGGFVALFAIQIYWKIALSTFAVGWVMLAIAGFIASCIERECLTIAKADDAKSTLSASRRADSSQPFEGEPLPWNGPK